MGIAIILIGLIVIFGIPAWVPLIKKTDSTPIFRWAFALAVVGQLMQAIFIAAVALHALTLDYSLRFALVGLVIFLAGVSLGITSMVKNGIGAGCLITDGFTALCWLFLITLH